MPDDRVIATRVLSLGAGVQSSTLALLASHEDGRLRDAGYALPDVAVFADTGWEPAYVYRHLDWLEEQINFPLIRVTAGDLRSNLRKGLTASGHRFVDVPLFLVDENGKKGMLRRQCTNHYKIKPINRAIRQLAGGRRGRPFPRDRKVEMWIGISRDEVARMKPSREKWIEHRWPLVDIGMTRTDCHEWFEAEYPGRHLPRSACVVCPYRSSEHWIELKELEPASFEEAVSFDKWLRNSKSNPVRSVVNGRPYLHSARKPLDSVIKTRELSPGEFPDSFTDECDGVCSV